MAQNEELHPVPAWEDNLDLHPDDVGKRMYSDDTGRTYVLDDPLPVRDSAACRSTQAREVLADVDGGSMR